MQAETRMAVPADEAAKLLGIARTRGWKRIGDGEIASFKLGKRRMISTSELRRFIDRKTSEAQA